MRKDNELRANSRELRPSIRILIADDHAFVRHRLRILLDLENDFNVVGEAADGREVLDKVQELDPDVLLLDLWMPHLDGLTTLQSMARLNNHTKVIVLTASEDTKAFARAMKLGCYGIVRKQTAPELIIESIRKVQGGEVLHDFHTAKANVRE